MKLILALIFLAACATDEICKKVWDGEKFKCVTEEERCKLYRMYCPGNKEVVETTVW